MAFVWVITIVIYSVLIAWTWQSLGTMEKMKKIMYLAIGLILVYGVTFFIFQISKKGMVYENSEIENRIRTLLIAIFSGVNGVIFMPQIAKIVDRIRENEVEKEQIKRKIILLCILLVVCFIFETGYMQDTQKGIMQVYHARQ